ncbi:hypothetical protein [Actinoplanes sp. NPDC051494]|uniref:Rv0361 family membrane protein n=1 Tax=Actinoplanes sp. NPDC051494 TaxID=3363907 RepID=UPI003790EF41
MTQPSQGGPAHLDATTEEFEPLIPFEPFLAAETLEGEVVWHQAAPSAPFHAKHEKPGEWHTHPPDHLAFEHSPPAEVQPGVQHDEPDEAIPLSMLPHPWEVPFDPHGTETATGPQRRRNGRWVVFALVMTLLLFAGGTASAYLLLRDSDNGKGAPDPATAVERFMSAVYTQQSATSAAEFVCKESRDTDRLQSRVDQVKGYADEYTDPSFDWTEPSVTGQTTEKAMVAVQLTMTTGDEKSARQELTFTVIRKTSWLVCDVNG